MIRASKQLESIINDKFHGSAELAENLITLVKENYNNFDFLNEVCRQSLSKLHHFPVITDFIEKLRPLIVRNQSARILIFTDAYLRGISKKYQIISGKALKCLNNKNSFLTISHSKTLLEVFKLLNKKIKRLNLVVCESRPDLEGIQFHNELVKAGIKASLITEAGASEEFENIDYVIIGADQILKNGVVNKTGSRMLAILARYFNKKVFVFATKEKRINNKDVINKNFEFIEKELIAKIITD